MVSRRGRPWSTWSVVCSSPKRSSQQSSSSRRRMRVAVGVGRDEHVRGERGKAARHRPDVEVVDLDDVADRRRARGRPPSGSMPAGERSRKIRRRVAQQRPLDAQSISAATARPAIGSKRSQPVSEDRARRRPRCRRTRRGRSRRAGTRRERSGSRDRAARSTSVAARFTATPTSATTSTMPPRTSAGEMSRRTAP